MKTKHLQKVLSALVDDCGHEALVKALEKSRPQPKPQNAVDVVATLDVDDKKRRVLESLAVRYDAKDFIPNKVFMQEFLQRMGRNPTGASRQKLSGVVFRCLATWDTAQLEELDRLGGYSAGGLERYTEAIRSCGRPERG